ncbi:MAG: CapA family protein [Bacteroidales bacterium]|nr:CapA family protein [Bacteroidales bacterium]
MTKSTNILLYIVIALLSCSCKSNTQQKETITEPIAEDTITTSTREAKLTFVGDFLFEAPFFAAVDNGYDKNSYFKLVKKYFEDDDLSVGNMEVVIGNDQMKVSGDNYNFCAPRYIGELVASLDMQVMSTANNHTFDRGLEGINSTLDFFDGTDIVTVGTYRNQQDRETPRIVEKNGIKFGFLAYTLSTNQIVSTQYRNLVGLYRNPETRKVTDEYKNLIASEMSALRPQVDVLIVMMHWGTEFTFEPNSEQKEMAKFLNEHGADIVYGSHSHSMQPVEFIGDEHKTLVYYSLGNFASQDDDIARTPKGQETFDNAYQVGLLSQFKVRLDNGKVEFSDLTNHLIVNHLNYDMKKFALVPSEQYDEFYEKTHLRYNLGFSREFINGLYEVVNKNLPYSDKEEQ